MSRPSVSFNTSQQSLSNSSSYQKRIVFGDISLEVQNVQEENNLNNEQKLKKLGEIIDKVESEAPSINNTSLYTGDHFLHSRVLKDTSELTVRCTEEVTGEVNTYDKFELAKHVAENPEFWDFTFPHEVPPCSYLHGTFAPTPLEDRPRVKRKRTERQRTGDLKVAQTVDQAKNKQEEKGSKKVEQVLRFLKKACRNGPISYFHVALDPKCFTRTIENIYHLSFLVRDGLVSVTIDEEAGLPFIKCLNLANVTSGVTVANGEKRTPESVDPSFHQFVISMDMQKWKELVRAFDLRDPMMEI